MTQAQWCKFRCFFAQNWRPLLPNCIRAIFKKRKNRRNWRLLLAKKLRGRGFELKWRCFVRVPWVLPRAEKKTRDFEKTGKKEQKSAKKRDFWRKTKDLLTKVRKSGKQEDRKKNNKKHKKCIFRPFSRRSGIRRSGIIPEIWDPKIFNPKIIYRKQI